MIPEYWRDKADELRAAADNMRPETARIMLGIAADYDYLADRAAWRLLQEQQH